MKKILIVDWLDKYGGAERVLTVLNKQFDFDKCFTLINIMSSNDLDRVFNGKTVSLGEGNADFLSIFKKLKQIKYKGNFILQGARSKNNQHALVVKEYRNFIIKYLINS